MRDLTTSIQEGFYQNAGASTAVKDNPTYKKFLKENGNDIIIKVRGRDYFYCDNSFISVEDVENEIKSLIDLHSTDPVFEITRVYITSESSYPSVNKVRFKIEYKFNYKNIYGNDCILDREKTIYGIFYDMKDYTGYESLKRVVKFLKTGKIADK